MRKEDYGVVTFKSTSHAIKGEGVFKDEGIEFKTIPTPREITSSCGLSIRFSLDDMKVVEKIIEFKELAVNGIYKMSKEGMKYTVEKIH